jgi:hypothetical protein
MIEAIPNERSVRFKMGDFFLGFYDRTGLSVPSDVKKDTYAVCHLWSARCLVFLTEPTKFIETALVDQGLVTPKQRDKYMFMEEDLDVTLTVLWTEKDTYLMAHYTRLILNTATLFFCGTGARIAAIFPEAKDKYKKGLRYKVLSMTP